MIATFAACASSSPPPAPAHHAESHPYHGACAANGNIVAVSPPSADEPILVLYERDSWLSGFDLPALVIWADGTVAYNDVPGPKARHLLRANLPLDEAATIVQSALSELRAAPVYTEVSATTDLPSVQIVVRDLNAWRSVDVYGLERSTNDAGLPPAVQSVATVYRRLLKVRPPASGPIAQPAERPRGWPSEAPAYRGQVVVDRVVRCAFART